MPARGGAIGGARTAGNPGMKNSEDAPRDRLKERRKVEAWPGDPAGALYPVFRARCGSPHHTGERKTSWPSA
ncbi:protein of unknown function [Methanoculleus bourgensis]|uniref:Uncharacterized protein n=1 Tax=Methanoculleus bourgensis TaxID=83986 RepID=A0A0X3BM91_9EURY|nr:protein of unknown function [Methanoculleus bourgensis]